MKINKEIYNKIKPWMFLASFCAVLIYIVINSEMLFSFIKRFLNLFVPLYYGIGIAYFLNLPMSRIERSLKKTIHQDTWFYKKVRGISILITLVLTFIVLTVLLSIIIPEVIDSIVMLFNNISTYIGNVITYINELIDKLSLSEEFAIDFDPNTIRAYFDAILKDWEAILNNATQIINDAGPIVINNALAFTASLGQWFMGFMLSIYLLNSKEKFIRIVRKMVAAMFDAESTKTIFSVASRTNLIFTRFFSGQLVEACILGTLIYVGMRIFNLGSGYQLLIAVTTAVTSIIPMFGAMLAMAFGFILIVATNPQQAIWFIIFYQVTQQFEGNVIYPKVVGKSVGLPGVFVLLSIVVFTGLFGLFGAFIAVPATAVLYILCSDYIHDRLKKKNMIVTEDEFIAENKNYES